MTTGPLANRTSGPRAGTTPVDLPLPSARPNNPTPEPGTPGQSAPAEPPTARSSAEHERLQQLAAEGAVLLEKASASEVLAWVAKTFDRSAIAVTSSMADGVLPALAASAIPGVDVLFINTGYHFSDTLITRDLVTADLDINLVEVTSPLSVQAQAEAYGSDLFARDPATCCRLRKVEPLRAALAPYQVWLTGLRRDESPTRANAPVVSWDENFGIIKVNPLVDWSADDVTAYALENNVPVNLLLSDGYPSIGCEPCTRRVAPGEDPRSGRWAGLTKTECGLHAPATSEDVA